MSSSRVQMQFHGLLDRLGRLDRCGDEVHLEASAEPAAQEGGVHAHLFGFQTRGLGGGT